MQETEIGGEAGDAVDAEQMRHRLQPRHLGEMPGEHGGIILPAGVTEHDIARRKSRCFRGHDFCNAAARHHGVGLDRSAVGGAVHPCPVGGVQRDIACLHKHLAVLRFGNAPVDQLEMFGSQLAGRLLDQQDLTIDRVVHGVSPLSLTVLDAVGCA